MNKLLFSICLVAATILSGCAVGPLVSHETARTVGETHHELIGGLGVAGYVVKWTYGLSENLDLGLHWESLSIGIRAKYAFINNRNGWSFATALGTGTSIGGSHVYADIMGSYLSGAWEPYSTARFVRVKTDPVEFKDEDTGNVDFTVPHSHYEYGQFILGTRYWISPHWLLSLEASSIFALTSDLKIGNDALVGVALGYLF